MTEDRPGTPNVLLVVLDSVRAANTGLHGHHRDTTPALERLAADGGFAAFEQARSPGTTSITSHASVFTGLPVRRHALTGDRSGRRLAPGHTIWEHLDAAGYATGVFSNNPFLTELDVGLDAAFETVVGRRQEMPFPEAVNVKNFLIDAGSGDVEAADATGDDGGADGTYRDFLRAAIESGRPLRSAVNGLAFKLDGTRTERLLPGRWRLDDSATAYVDAFLDWERDRSRPWAGCVNLMDAHFPYRPRGQNNWGDEELCYRQTRLQRSATDPWSFLADEEARAELREMEPLYDGAIRYLDGVVDRLVETLRTRGLLEETLVVVTADHGEGFGEPSRLRPGCRSVGHGNGGVGEVLCHVPLLVRPPGGAADAGRIDGPATLAGFPAAVAEACDAVGDRRDGAVAPVLDAAAADSLPVSDPVLAAFLAAPTVVGAPGIEAEDAAVARDHGVDPTPYTEPADAIYEPLAEGVRKHASWGPERLALDVADAQSATVDGTPDEERLAGLRSQEPADVLERTDDEGVSAATERRLAELGYR